MLTSLLKASMRWQKKSSFESNFLLCLTVRLFTQRELPKQDVVCKCLLITWDSSSAQKRYICGIVTSKWRTGGKHKLNTIFTPICDWFPQVVCIISLLMHSFLHLISISHETNHLSSHKQRVTMGHARRGSLANRHTHSTMPKTYARTFSFAARPCLQISRREICQNTCQVLVIAPYISMTAICSTSS